jgi:hypothetical protein
MLALHKLLKNIPTLSHISATGFLYGARYPHIKHEFLTKTLETNGKSMNSNEVHS